MNFKKFISELKRRNVFKVATAYAITGWLIIQIVTSISEPLSLPKWFDPVIIIIVLIGFPLSLLFAWAFELTPEGLKKTKQVEVVHSKTKTTGKKLNLIIITALLLLIAFLLNDKFSTKPISKENNISSVMPSIAVLPFADMSPKNDQEYFSDGLSEELLNVLAKINNIKVAGRTSSFKFKGKNDDLKKIGAELGVAHILEGSVRKSGNKIRITAQLIKVNDGFHMWSETYDEDYTADKLFQIQDDISKKILKELKIKLSINDETKISENKLTSDTKSYEAYLKGNQLLVNRKPKDIEQAIVEFKKAIALDNKFTMAYARLATSYGHLFNYGSIKREIAFKNIRDNVDKALLLNSNLGSAYAALGHYYKDKNLLFNKSDENSYKEAMKKAYELEPNNPEVIMWYANSLDWKNDLKLKLYLDAYEIDPLAPVIISNLSTTYKNNEEYKKAEEYAKRNIEINPEYIRSRIFLIEMLTSKPNSKLGEGLIEAYKAYIKYPENLDVLKLLVNLSIELNIINLSIEVEKIMTKVYPENASLVGIKVNNLILQEKYTETINFVESFFKKVGIKDGSQGKLGFVLFKSSFFNKNFETTYSYLEKYHPIYLSDTLTTVSDEIYYSLSQVIPILKKVHKTKQVEKLKEVYHSKLKKEFKHNGDITKEEIVVLNRISELAAINGNGKLYSEILNERYFNRKDKFNNTVQYKIDPLFDDIRNQPEVIEIYKRINEDLAKMKAKAIVFLKNEGVWDKYKE